MIHTRRLVLLWLVLLLVSSCGGDAASGDLPDKLPTSEVPGTNVVVSSSGPKLPVGRLLFVKEGDIWMFEGSQIQRLTTSNKTVQPGWAPDGQRIAYVQREESYADIYVKSLTEQQRGTRVTRNEPPGIEARSRAHVRSVTWAFYPRWSPDGKWLAFVSQGSAPYCLGGSQNCENPIEYPLSLYLYRSADLIQQVRTTPSNEVLVVVDTDLTHPAWSPDGQLIAFTRLTRCPQRDCPMSIGFYDLATGEQFNLPGVPDGAYDPVWSPDGKWLVFARRSGSESDLWAIAAPSGPQSGGTPFKLTDLGNVRAPTWSPDGSYLAFFRLHAGSVSLELARVQQGSNGNPLLADPQTLLKNEPLDVDSGLSWGP